MDLIACTFNMIMVLDGVVYTEYAYVLSFCILIPGFFDVLSLGSYALKRLLVAPVKIKDY